MARIFNKKLEDQGQSRTSAKLISQLQIHTSSQVIHEGSIGSFNHVIPSHYTNLVSNKKQSG